jgi:alpha-beta hydrolase superfamily lysophospholipase
MNGSFAKGSRDRKWLYHCAAGCGALLALLALFSCAPDSEGRVQLAAVAASESTPAARFSETEFIAADGERLPMRKWLPRGEVKAVILGLHGFNDYSNAFDIPAQEWAKQGVATFAYDQRGFGATQDRYRWAGSAPLAADVVTAAKGLRARYPGRPLYLLGESMGAAIATVAMTGAVTSAATASAPGAAAGAAPGAAAGAAPAVLPPPDVDGVILSAPAVWGRATMELVPKLALFAGVRLFPEMTLSGRGLQIMASDNLPMLRALGRDPLVIKETRIDAIYGLVDLMDLAQATAPRLNAPVLVMYGAHDDLVPTEALRSFVSHLPRNPEHTRRLAYYPRGYHLLLRDLEGPIVANDVVHWMLDRAAPLPSHADSTEFAEPWPPKREGSG